MPRPACGVDSLAQGVKVDLAELRQDHRVLKLACDGIAHAREGDGARVVLSEKSEPSAPQPTRWSLPSPRRPSGPLPHHDRNRR